MKRQVYRFACAESIQCCVFRDFFLMECYLLRISYRHFALVCLRRLPLVSPSLRVPYFGGGLKIVNLSLFLKSRIQRVL